MLVVEPDLARSQKLHPNAGFEEVDIECIGGVGYMAVVDWSTPSCGNGLLYLNECNNTIAPFGGVPTNSFGHSEAHGGDAYCCILPFSYAFAGGNPKAYGTAMLYDTLVQGETYCLSFYLSLGDSSAYTTSALHAFLWYGQPSVCAGNDTLWDEYAAVTYDISAIGPEDWTFMEGSFVAEGGEVSLTLGSFLYGADIDTNLTGVVQLPNPKAAYFIDDVYLGPCGIGMSEQAGAAGMDLFPNPATDMIQVSRADAKIERLEVVNMVGSVVMRQMITSSPAVLNVSGLAAGPYLVRAYDQDRLAATRSFVKIAE